MIGALVPPSGAIPSREQHREFALGGDTFASMLAAPVGSANPRGVADASNAATEARQATKARERAWDQTNVRFDELHLLRSVDTGYNTGAQKSCAASSPRTIARTAETPPQHAPAAASPPAGADVARAVEQLASPLHSELHTRACAFDAARSTGGPATHKTAHPIHATSIAAHPTSAASRETKHLPSTRHPPLDGRGASSVFVAFNASAGGARIVARIGRMSPTERLRLRQGIDALLAEYGIHHASISVNGEGDATWPKSRQ